MMSNKFCFRDSRLKNGFDPYHPEFHALIKRKLQTDRLFNNSVLMLYRWMTNLNLDIRLDGIIKELELIKPSPRDSYQNVFSRQNEFPAEYKFRLIKNAKKAILECNFSNQDFINSNTSCYRSMIASNTDIFINC